MKACLIKVVVGSLVCLSVIVNLLAVMWVLFDLSSFSRVTKEETHQAEEEASLLDNFLKLNAQSISKVEYLDLSSSDISDEGLKVVGEFSSLQELRLFGCSRITDAGLAHLTGLTKLKTLTLDCTKTTDAGLVHVGKLNKLEWLSLSWTRVTDSGLKDLSNLTELRFLALSKNPGVKGFQISDKGLEQLQKLSKLGWIKLAFTEVSDEGLKHLVALPGLYRANLAGTKVTQAGIDGAHSQRPDTTFNFAQ